MSNICAQIVGLMAEDRSLPGIEDDRGSNLEIVTMSLS